MKARRKAISIPSPRFQMQARFFPSDTVKDRCIGHAELVFANAILLRGITVLQQGSTGKLSLRFPTYGSAKDSYVLPENKAVYMQMLRVIREAVKEQHFHTAEISGSTDLYLIARAATTSNADNSPWFDLRINDLCDFKGITIQQINADNICINLPSLPCSEGLHEQYCAVSVFQGLSTEHAVMINQTPCTDCASFIEDLVLHEYSDVYLSQQSS